MRYAYGTPGTDSFSLRRWIDADGQGDFDQTSETAEETWTRIINTGGVRWRATSQYIYARTGSSTRTHLGTERVRLSGRSGSLLSETQVVDVDGHVSTSRLSPSGRQRIETLTQSTNANSTVSFARRYLHGRLYREEDPVGRVQRHEYDVLGRRTATTDFEGRRQERYFSQDCHRLLAEMTNNQESQVGYLYHPEGAAVGSRNQLRSRYIVSPSHPAFGNPGYSGSISHTQSGVLSLEEFVYDSSGRIRETKEGGQLRSSISYDAFGRQDILKVHQSASVFSTVDWDYHSKTGQLTQRRDTDPTNPAALVSETYRYNPNGSLESRTDARGIKTSYTYTQGRLSGVSFSDSVTPSLSYSHHRSGMPKTVNNGVTGASTFVYDDNGSSASMRLAQVDLSSSFYGAVVDKFVPRYEASTSASTLKGRANGFHFGKGSSEVVGALYSHDYLGRRKEITTRSSWTSAGVHGTTFDLSYHSQSQRITSIASPLLATGEGHYAQVYGWNSDSRLATVASGHDVNGDGTLSTSGGTDFVNAHFSYSYDALGRKIWEVSRGQLFERFAGGAIATRFKYDVSGRLQSAVTYAGPETTESGATVPGRRFEFSYDHAGNLTSKKVEGSSFSHSPNKAHAYSSRQNPSTVSYTGMAGSDLQLGGQTAHQRLGDYFRHSPTVANTSGPVRHQLEVSSGEQSVNLSASAPRRSEPFAYDKAGNLVSDSQWSYSYDALNRLIKMEQKAASGLPSGDRLRLRFAYDEQNRRVEKVVEKLNSNQLLSRERYLYNGWNLVATLDAKNLSSIKMKSQYFWRTGSESTGAFGLLMIAGDHDGNASTPVKAFYTGYDGRGNLAVLAEQGRGMAAAAFAYSPFGERLRGEGSQFLPDLDSLGAHFGFATQFTDRESGLVYFGNRYYHPGLGRFITRDPLREAGGLNLYAYANNDPVNRTDYRGLCPSAYDSSGGWGSSSYLYTLELAPFHVIGNDIPPADEFIELPLFEVRESSTESSYETVQAYAVNLAVNAINSANQSIGLTLAEVSAHAGGTGGAAAGLREGDARKPQNQNREKLKNRCDEIKAGLDALAGEWGRHNKSIGDLRDLANAYASSDYEFVDGMLDSMSREAGSIAEGVGVAANVSTPLGLVTNTFGMFQAARNGDEIGMGLSASSAAGNAAVWSGAARGGARTLVRQSGSAGVAATLYKLFMPNIWGELRSISENNKASTWIPRSIDHHEQSISLVQGDISALSSEFVDLNCAQLYGN